MEAVAASHVHSTWSYDGSWSLEALRDKFKHAGCRVLMMTEHDKGFTPSRFVDYQESCARLSTAEILVMPGIEYSDPANCVHILVWGVPFLGEGLPTSSILEAVKSANGVAVLAHPSRKNAWACVKAHWADYLLGIEVWNRKYDGWAPSKTAPGLIRMAGAVPFVGLDFHTQRQWFPLNMVLDVAGHVNEETVIQCLRSRRCYARAFGLPVGRNLFRRFLPALSMAEQSRRTAASLVRYSRGLTR